MYICKKKMRYLTLLFLLSLTLLLDACYKGKSVDLVVHNARIHTMTDDTKVYEAMAIKDGKVLEVGPERQILNKYSAEEEIDAGGKDIYPGLTDAHGHLLSYAKQKLSVNLVGCKSFDELLVRTEKYQDRYKRKFVVGSGWDQSLWGTNDLPTNEGLNRLFPNTPVCLYRIDGHSLLANDAALKKAGIGPESNISGGIIHVKDGKCTGLLVDNAMEPMNRLIPPFSRKEIKSAILEIQQELFQYGIIGVHEAGIDFADISLFEELIDSKKLQLEVYAMLLPSKANKDFVRKQGKYRHKNLIIRSFKVMGDGALGSRGAFLKQPYSDQHNHFGVLTTPIAEMKRIANFCEANDYQMNTHAIGDSTNRILLDIYKSIFEVKPDHRWRIEHAQVVDPVDFVLFSNYGVFPSVQPTHAVSDQRWAEQRLGKQRMAGAYAYRTLLEKYGMLAIGTDFPVELTDPFLTIQAAVKRKNGDNFPAGGFYTNEAITLEECLKGMTIWAAFASFQENRTGSLEKGKEATFVIFEHPIQAGETYEPNFANHVFIRGKKVYSTDY
jgi:predicted amidohydrolase YtcJ